jgi:hypothetical protein
MVTQQLDKSLLRDEAAALGVAAVPPSFLQ